MLQPSSILTKKTPKQIHFSEPTYGARVTFDLPLLGDPVSKLVSTKRSKESELRTMVDGKWAILEMEMIHGVVSETNVEHSSIAVHFKIL